MCGVHMTVIIIYQIIFFIVFQEFFLSHLTLKKNLLKNTPRNHADIFCLLAFIQTI